MALLKSVRRNLMEYQKKVLKKIKQHSNFVSIFVDHHSLPGINLNGHCLIKNDIYIPKKVMNPYISDTTRPLLRSSNTYFTLSNCLFLSVKLTKEADLDKYKYT